MTDHFRVGEESKPAVSLFSELYALSFQGRRENNEDRVVVLHLGPRTQLLAVLDGMGGETGGELASQVVSDAIRVYLAEHVRDEVIEIKAIIKEMFSFCQLKLREAKEIHQDHGQMGTTLACVLVSGDRFAIGNLGDSRVYWMNSGGITQVTVDHTYVQQMLKDSPDLDLETVSKMYGHIVTKIVDGSGQSPDLFPIDSDSYQLTEGDSFILCSDGLIPDKGKPMDSSITEYLVGCDNLMDSAEQLVSLAYTEGSSDNISVILATYGTLGRAPSTLRRYRYPPDIPETEKIILPTKVRLQWWKSTMTLLIMGVTLLIATVVFVMDRSTEGVIDLSNVAPTRSLPWDPFGHLNLTKEVVLSAVNGDSLRWLPCPSDSVILQYRLLIDSRDSIVTPHCAISAELLAKTIGKRKGSVEVVALLQGGTQIKGIRSAEVKVGH